MNARIPAEIFPPGEFLKEELEVRGWTQIEFADIIGKDTRLVSEIISAKRAITPETAIVLSQALGTSPEFWMNLEGQYQLSKVRSDQNSISRKAQLHERFPVREMVKRGWVEVTKNIDVLEGQLLNFFGISNIDEDPPFVCAAKKRSYDEIPSMSQIAWLCRARKVSLSAPAGKFDASKLAEVVQELRDNAEFVDGTRNAASILARAGIRFVIVESLPGSKIDGACFWVDGNPVVALSLRFDRIDNFWHTLFHELDHVKHKEGMHHPVIDVDIFSTEDGEKPAIEIRANEAAANILISKKEMDGFIARVNPMFTSEQIVGFAKRMHIHPGIVVGQLHNKKILDWKFHRKHLEKFRDFVITSSLTDGFGRMLNDGI